MINKRINGRWMMQTNASKKRQKKREQLIERLVQLQNEGKLTSKIRKSFELKIERLMY